jgi:hypothetical protein
MNRIFLKINKNYLKLNLEKRFYNTKSNNLEHENKQIFENSKVEINIKEDNVNKEEIENIKKEENINFNEKNDKINENYDNTEKILTVEEIRNQEMKEKEELENKRNIEVLVRKLIFRAIRSLILLFIATLSFFIVIDSKGKESSLIKYLEEKRNLKKLKEEEINSQNKMEELEKDLVENFYPLEEIKGNKE